MQHSFEVFTQKREPERERERERDERTMGEKCTVGCNGSVARHYNYVRSAVLICCNNDTIEKVSQ